MARRPAWVIIEAYQVGSYRKLTEGKKIAAGLSVAVVVVCCATAIVETLTTGVFFPTVATKIIVYAAYWAPFFIAGAVSALYSLRSGRLSNK